MPRTTMSKLFLTPPVFLLLLGFALAVFPISSEAAGLVPCGGCQTQLDSETGMCPAGQEQPPCNFCHIFQLLSNVITFLLVPDDELNGGFAAVPILATLLVAVGGFFLFAAAGSPQNLDRGKGILIAVAVGLLIIYGSWVFLNLVFQALGVVGWTGLGNWWEIDCAF